MSRGLDGDQNITITGDNNQIQISRDASQQGLAAQVLRRRQQKPPDIAT